MLVFLRPRRLVRPVRPGTLLSRRQGLAFASASTASRRLDDVPEDTRNRQDLALAYRLSAQFGWEELIYNHLTCRLRATSSGAASGPSKEQFLINPYGLGFDEVTASNLVAIDSEGNVLDPGTGTGRVNRAGFLIHSAVHAARDDAKCVIHFHPEDVVAVSSRKEGLLPVGQAYYALGNVTYHDYEGLALLEGEKRTLVRDLGPTSKVMILRNHGALTCGSTIAEAFIKMFYVIRACQQQVKAGPGAMLPPGDIQRMATEQAVTFNSEGFGVLEFEYLRRKYERAHGRDYAD